MRIILVDISAFLPAFPAASILWNTPDSCGISQSLLDVFPLLLLVVFENKTSTPCICIYLASNLFPFPLALLDHFMFSHFWIRAFVSWPITFLWPRTTPRHKPLRAIPGGLVKVRCGGPGSPPAPYDCVRESESRWAWERDKRGGQRMESSGCNPFPLCWARGASVYSYPPPLPSMSPTYSTAIHFHDSVSRSICLTGCGVLI